MAINILDLGARANGPTSDSTEAFQDALDLTKASGGKIIVPDLPPGEVYRVSKPLLIEDHLHGLQLEGEGLPEIRYTASTGHLFDIRGSQRLNVRHLRLTYDHPDYNDVLVSVRRSPPRHFSNYVHIEDCSLGGESGRYGAKALIHLETTIACSVRNTDLTAAVTGILLGTEVFANITQLTLVSFHDLVERAVRFIACEALRIESCTFSPTHSGKCSGIEQMPMSNGEYQHARGFYFANNWCGDVMYPEGKQWVQVRPMGGIIGPGFNWPPAGDHDSDDVCLRLLEGSEGCLITGNLFQGPAIKVMGPCRAIAIIANTASSPVAMNPQSYGFLAPGLNNLIAGNNGI